MTTYCLEMRSTADWATDIRYRAYTTSAWKAEIFRSVPKIQFTDSGHGIVPVVAEHRGKRLPLINTLADHVGKHMRSGGGSPRAGHETRHESDSLEKADAILRRLKIEIVADAHPAQYQGDIKKKQGWIDDLDAALLELEAHYALTKKGKRRAKS